MLGSTVLRAPDDGGKIRSLETKKGINSQVSYLLLLYLQTCVREVKGQSFGTPSTQIAHEQRTSGHLRLMIHQDLEDYQLHIGLFVVQG